MENNGPEADQKIFIAHSRQDSSVARALSRALDRRGLTVLAEDPSARGARLGEGLRHALQSASWYVVLVSEESLDSPLVYFEIGAALAQGKPVLPVFLSAAARRRAISPLKRHKGIAGERLTAKEIADKVARAIQRAA